MDWRLGMAIGAALLVAGCGDDSGESDDQAELSGIFQAGDVNGVHYHTPTRDGLTDASGTFKYLPGETVAFSIGGIQLGAVPGASAVTLFTLAGMTPPTTEPALRRELDVASRTTSNFVRAINMDRLLLALDADHNPANGIDVRGHEGALANATIDFNETIYDFAAHLEKLAPNLTHNLPRWFPVVQLYRALDIVVPVHAPVQYDFEGAFFSAQQTVISYYPDGSRKSQDSFGEFSGAAYGTSYAYDSLGRPTEWRSWTQPGHQGKFSEEERLTYDARGTPTAQVRVRDEGADGTIDYSWSASFEFDAFNNALRQVSRHDFGNDGNVDRLEEYRATFDTRLNRVRTIQESDEEANGSIDSRYELTADYDSRNRVIAQLVEWDGDVDGVVDARETYTTTYAGSGPDSVMVYERDDDVDGVAELTLTQRWVYASGGTLLTFDLLQVHDAGEAGETKQHTLEVATYDGYGRSTSAVISRDWDGHPGYDSVDHRVLTYAAFGSPLRLVTEADTSGDGVVDSRYTIVYEYGASGELLGVVNTSEQAPGWAPMIERSAQVTNVLLADGVLMLAQYYLESPFDPAMVAAF